MGHDLKKRERHEMGIWSREENVETGKEIETRRPRHWKFEAFFVFLNPSRL